MADVKITVDSSDLQLLNDWLNKTDQKVKVLTKSANDNFQTFKKQRQELENVRRSLDPLYAATVDFEAKLEVLNRELKDTAPAEYARRLEQLRKQAQRAGLQVNNMNKVIGMSNKGTRRFELGMQQAGYQVQDFIVQVQSGTNFLIAFSQQGSQLAGFFAGPWGAAIGVGIAALSSFAIGVMAANGEVKDLAEELDELESLNDALDSFGETFGQKFTGNIEAVREVFGDLVADIYEKEIRDVQSAIRKDFKMGVGAGFAESAAGSDGLYRQVEETGIMGIPTQGAFEAARELDKRKAEIQNILNSLSDTDIVSKEALSNAFSAAYLEMKNLGYVSDEYLTQLQAIANENGLHVKQIESIGEAQDEVNKKAKVTDDQRLAAANKVLQAKIALNVAETEFGKLSNEAETAALNLAEAERKRANLGKDINAGLEQSQKSLIAQDVTQQYLSARDKDAQKRLERRNNFLDQSVHKYQQLALAEEKGGKAAVEATRRAKEQTALRNAALSAGVDIMGTEYLQLVDQLRVYQDLRKAREDIAASQKLEKIALQAILSAENKVVQEKINLLKAQGEITSARKLEVDLARSIAYQRVMSRAATEEEKQQLMASALEAAKLAAETVETAHATEDAKENAEKLADAYALAARSAASIGKALKSNDVTLAGLRAQAAVLRSGGGETESEVRGAVAKRRESLLSTFQVSSARELTPKQQQQLDKELSEAEEEARLRAEINKLTKDTSDKKIKSTQDEIDKLMQAVKVDETRLKVGEEEARQLEILQDLRRFNADADVKLTDAQLKAAAARIAQAEQEIQTLEELKDRQEDLANTIETSMADAFMSITDGTKSAKDAFRDMASEIIKELYRIYYVKKATRFITDAIGLFTGAAPGSSESLFDGTRALGGPVEQGKTYLVGERGPELFTAPSNGNIVPNNKLGGSSVVVNQTINVTTGVQQTVRTEIKTLMPQIAESAKAAVMEAKRRGGSYGRALA